MPKGHALVPAKHAQLRRFGMMPVPIIYDTLPSSVVRYTSANSDQCAGVCSTQCKRSDFEINFGRSVSQVFNLVINNDYKTPGTDYSVSIVNSTTIKFVIFRCSETTPFLYRFLIQTDGGNFTIDYTIAANQ